MNKRQIKWEQFIVSTYLLSNGLALYAAIQSLPESRFFATFYSMRLGFMILAIIFSFVRQSKRFYFAVFREMSNRVYWVLVTFVMLIMKGLFLHKFIELSPKQKLVDFSFVTGLVIFLLTTYQGRIWASDEDKERQRRIAELARKAKLSKKQLKAVTSILVESAKKEYNMPWTWKLTTLVLAIIWGATLSTYADAIVNFLLSEFVNFSNSLPPY